MTPAAGVAAAAPAGAETVGEGGAPGLHWTVQRAPFRLAFIARHRQIVAQAPGEIAGPGGRMAYALADGTTHRLTDLLRQRGAGTA